MDVSALSTVLERLSATVATAFGILGPDAEAVLRYAMALSYSLALVLWLWEGRPAVHGPFLRMLLKFAAIGWLMEWFPEGSYRLMQAATGEAARLVPGGFALDDPGRIAHLGILAVAPLLLRVKEMLGPVDFFLNFVEIVLFLLAALIVVVAFCVLAVQVFLAFLEYRLLSLAAYLAIPFAVLTPTSFIAERSIGYIAASALKLLVLGVVVAVCGTTLLTLTFEGTPTLAQAFGVAVLSAALLVLAIKAPRAAAGLINGGPVMDGAAALAGLWTAGRLGARAAVGVAVPAMGAAGAAAGGIAAVWGHLRTAALATNAGRETGGGAPSGFASSPRRYPAGTAGGPEPNEPADRKGADRKSPDRRDTGS